MAEFINLDSFIVALVSVVILYTLLQLLKFAREKNAEIDNEQLRAFNDYVITMAETIIGSLNQSVVNKQKEAGKFGAKEALEVKDEAIKNFDALLKDTVKDMMDFSDDQYKIYRENLIEDAVGHAKHQPLVLVDNK